MGRILVVYYSRTGHVRQVAQAIAGRLGAELVSINEPGSRMGFCGYLRSAWEALRGREADIHAPGVELSDYDLIVIGTPVWAGHASSPARTFVRRHHGRIQRAGLFCTQGGSGGERALHEMQQELRKPALATLVLDDAEIRARRIDEKVGDFAGTLRAGLSDAATAPGA